MPKPLPSKRIRILLLLSVAGLTAASVGLALADAGRRPARRAATLPPGTVDCQALNARLRTCAAHIAATVDPEVPDRLGRMAGPLKHAITSVMADELQARVGGACRASRGRMSEGAAVIECLGKAAQAEKAPCPATGPESKPEGCATWRKGQACVAFSACLKKGFASLPAKPKKTK